MEYEKEVNELLNDIVSRSKDEMIDRLIELGEKNIFIPVMIAFIKVAKAEGKYTHIRLIEEYMNAAYSPGLRAHILDDFIREKVKLYSEINDLKTVNNLYVLEQKAYLYEQVESMLRSTSTAGATYAIMKILEFRGDKRE